MVWSDISSAKRIAEILAESNADIRYEPDCGVDVDCENAFGNENKNKMAIVKSLFIRVRIGDC
ncbi:hypothetical protein DSECCO2_638190 [anaerobic digester metagenome]